MNLLDRQGAITECYPSLTPEQISCYAVIYLPIGATENELVYLWLPTDEKHQSQELELELINLHAALIDVDELSPEEILDYTGSP